jgi:integrase
MLQQFDEDLEAARRRGVQQGYLYKRGPSWLVQFTEYARGENGTEPVSRCERVGPCVGPERLTKQEAQREANRLYLDDINRRNLKPSSSMLVKDFITAKFEPQVVEKRKPGGRKHYAYILRRFIVPLIGERRLCDIDADAVELLMARVRSDLSHQTVLHCQHVVSRIFGLAIKLRLYHEINPASVVEAGEAPLPRKRPGYTWHQAALVLARLREPARLMAKLSIATSMNIAEICGLRLRWCNFTDQIQVIDGEVLAPFTVGVRENWYDGQRGSLKTGKRMRNLGVPLDLAAELVAYIAGRENFHGPDDPLFCSRTGTPVDQHNLSNRILRPLSVKLGFPVTWHGFRRAHSTFVGTFDGVAVEDRVATMGHADARMTLHYSLADVERRRGISERILTTIAAEVIKPEELADDLAEMKTDGGVQ